MRRIAVWLRDTRGTAAVEFAILTPVFLLLLTGMLAYGIYFGAAHSLQQLAADAARTAIAALDDEDDREALVKAFLDANADIYGLIDRDLLDHVVRNGDDADQFIVKLTYDASQLPIWNLYPPLPLPSQRIVTISTIRMGGR